MGSELWSTHVAPIVVSIPGVYAGVLDLVSVEKVAPVWTVWTGLEGTFHRAVTFILFYSEFSNLTREDTTLFTPVGCQRLW
jgi:hypothetical protein